MKEGPRDLPRSVHQRLLNRSASRGEDFQFIMQRYAVERLLARLAASDHRDRFVLKGAMMFVLWADQVYRPTRDLDLAGHGDPNPASMLTTFREIVAVLVPDDGLVFPAESLRAEPIREAAEYVGVRLRMQARLGRARIPVQVDIGFGDPVEPAPEEVEFPALLDGPGPRIRAYPRKAVIAEKLHAMLVLGAANSRMKDYYDIFVLSRVFDFDGPVLVRAVAATLRHRAMGAPESVPPGLAEGFFADPARTRMWEAFLDRGGLRGAPRGFERVGNALRAFLGPVLEALTMRKMLVRWSAGGPWRSEPTP